MRVLFCTLDYPPSAAGGAEQQARLQAESLARRGHRIDVVCARTPGHSSETIDGVRVHRLPRVEIRYLRTVTYLVMLAAFLTLRLRRYDLVHVHLANLQADIAVAIARVVRRPSYVKVAAGGPLGEIGRLRPISWITRYSGLRHAALVQAISEEIADDVRRIGVPDSRILRIPNGVIAPRTPTTRNGRATARAELGLDPDDTIVLYAGRMERAKGVGELLASWRGLDRDGATLLLVGRPGLKEPVAMSSLPPRAEYHPWTTRMGAYLRAADIFVLPSYTEGMSNAMLEAMAAGLPTIATRVGAAAELVSDGSSGLLIDAGDRDGLDRALTTLLSDASLRTSLGATGRRTVMRRYDIEAVVTAIEQGYQTLMAAR